MVSVPIRIKQPGETLVAVDILHVVPAFYPTRGGIEVLVENLTGYLNERSSRTHAVLAPRTADERLDVQAISGTTVYSVDCPDPEAIRRHHQGIEQLANEHREFARILIRARVIIANVQPRLLHIHGLSALGTAASVVAKSLDIPVMLHIHGSIGGALSQHMEQRIHTAISVVAVSEFVRTSIQVEAGRTDGVHVIRNGLPDPRKDLFLEDVDGPMAVTMVGRLEKAKGFDVGLRAIALLLPQFPTLHVHLVGVGTEEVALRQLGDELGLSKHLTLHGRKEAGETLALLHSSACVVVPSLAYEGFSLVALEAAFLERPVVAHRVGGLPETVLDGVTGTVVSAGDIPALATAISMYLDSRELRTTIGQQARQRALELFTLERMAKELDELYESQLRAISQPTLSVTP